MCNYSIAFAMLVCMVALASAGLSHHGHGLEAISYSVVTKHDDQSHKVPEHQTTYGHQEYHSQHDHGYQQAQFDHNQYSVEHHTSTGLPQHGHGHEAISYSMVTKHDDESHKVAEHQAAYGHQEHDHGYHQDQFGHNEYSVEHHTNNDQEHDEYQGHHEHQHEDYNDHHSGHSDHVKYEFQYGVKDPKTGDIKDQWETRDGHSVKGTYSLKEADGTTRVVKYSADKKKGFEAIVHKIGNAHHDSGHH